MTAAVAILRAEAAGWDAAGVDVTLAVLSARRRLVPARHEPRKVAFAKPPALIIERRPSASPANLAEWNGLEWRNVLNVSIRRLWFFFTLLSTLIERFE